MDEPRIRTDCPVCGGGRPNTFLSRADVPVYQNLLYVTEAEARASATGLLQLAACPDCGFVFNQAVEPHKLEYGLGYDNNQTCSPSFVDHVEERIEELVKRRGVRNQRVIEVGCGDGDFIERLVRDPAWGNTGHGFDPSYDGPASVLDGRLQFHRTFYDRAAAGVPADVVISRHVIEHVPEPLAMLRHVREALAASPHARVFFETPCVDWILRNNVIWDFFYEHCSYFTADSLTLLFHLSGFDVVAVDQVFNGQYLWLEAVPASAPAAPSPRPRHIPDLVQVFAAQERRTLSSWRTWIRSMRRDGPLAIWGAGAKGVTFANLVDADRELVSCVVDINPLKQGKYLASTAHPVVDYRELPDRGVRAALLMNPNYYDENAALLRDGGIEVELIDLMAVLPA